jgi:uncharacterized membrane protein
MIRPKQPMNARTVALAGVGIALVAVMVSAVRIPVPATGGYWHTGVIAETFLATAFGPLIGGVSAGVGAAIADLLGGFGSFAPLTLIAHGSTGLLVGWLAWRKGWSGMLLGWVVGGLSQVALYFIGEATIYGFGVAGAALELAGNLVQVGLGIFGLLLFRLVRQAYPQLEHLGAPAGFEEV